TTRARSLALSASHTSWLGAIGNPSGLRLIAAISHSVTETIDPGQDRRRRESDELRAVDRSDAELSRCRSQRCFVGATGERRRQVAREAKQTTLPAGSRTMISRAP